ncbi:hypothetical protein [Nocardia sp. NPDC059195]|uniref:hypothetical protein n=1 Tax=Nocardia sp. NPDC059195 TaxID=3346765 RepID=UPI0036A4B08B
MKPNPFSALNHFTVPKKVNVFRPIGGGFAGDIGCGALDGRLAMFANVTGVFDRQQVVDGVDFPLDCGDLRCDPAALARPSEVICDGGVGAQVGVSGRVENGGIHRLSQFSRWKLCRPSCTMKARDAGM